MKNNTTTQNRKQTSTPRGLTQNWNFIEANSKARKGRKGGPFVSRQDAIRKRLLAANGRTVTTVTERGEDNTTFTVNALEDVVKVQPRQGGKFSGKQQVYTRSMAEKLGLL